MSAKEFDPTLIGASTQSLHDLHSIVTGVKAVLSEEEQAQADRENQLFQEYTQGATEYASHVFGILTTSEVAKALLGQSIYISITGREIYFGDIDYRLELVNEEPKMIYYVESDRSSSSYKQEDFRGDVLNSHRSINEDEWKFEPHASYDHAARRTLAPKDVVGPKIFPKFVNGVKTICEVTLRDIRERALKTRLNQSYGEEKVVEIIEALGQANEILGSILNPSTEAVPQFPKPRGRRPKASQ